MLIVRDGWGRNPNPSHDAFNAIKIARTPFADELEETRPVTLIKTSGLDVGLPDGTMGNSEVGHQNIGAGRVVDQESVRISKAAASGAFAENEALAGAIRSARDSGGRVHLMGIASDAGVHGLLDHAEALIKLCAQERVKDVFVHAFTDGRDTGPYTGAGYADRLERMCEANGVGRVASVIGRYWAMDRDNRWERVARAYACLTGREADDHGVAHYASVREGDPGALRR